MTRCQIFEECGNGSKKATVEHFVKEGVPCITIYKILQRLDECGTVERKVGSGQKVTIMMSKKVEALCKTFNTSKNMSYRVVAQKFECSKTLVHYTAKKSSTLLTVNKNPLHSTKKARKRQPKKIVENSNKVLQINQLSKMMKNISHLAVPIEAGIKQPT